MLLAACGGPAPTYTPRDPALRQLPLFFYLPAATGSPPRAFVFFLGNDVGFWQPHRNLAARLSAQGYAITGFDIRPLLASLPDSEPARDSVFAVKLAWIIGASRAEVGADSLPLVLSGHSLGAELAIWSAAHVPLSHLTGVLALAPGSRSHLRITVSDIANSSEPTDPRASPLRTRFARCLRMSGWRSCVATATNIASLIRRSWPPARIAQSSIRSTSQAIRSSGSRWRFRW